jgi:SNF2 family DNA or RNA helicase
LDRLNKIIKESSSRVLKDEVLDIPAKLYSKRYFEMTKEQQRVYQELRDEYITILQSGEVVTAALAIVRLLRQQQITCGYLPTQDDEEEPFQLIGEKNPRLDLLREICEGLPHKTMIWARFSKDIDMIMDMLGDEAVRYDGKINEDERAENKLRFQKDPKIKWHVGNPSVGSEGLTYTMAKSVVYYNNSFKLLDRLQSEDRCHRAGQTDHVNYIDIAAQGTVDEHIIRNLVKKVDIASQITGDQLKEWL